MPVGGLAIFVTFLNTAFCYPLTLTLPNKKEGCNVDFSDFIAPTVRFFANSLPLLRMLNNFSKQYISTTNIVRNIFSICNCCSKPYLST